MVEQIAELKSLLEKATPGPWRWEFNLACKSVSIESHRWVVMDFVRWGTNSAAPAFAAENRVLTRVDQFAEVQPGREHHASWHRLVSHPDAQLMVAAVNAAPALIARIDELEKKLESRGTWKSSDIKGGKDNG